MKGLHPYYAVLLPRRDVSVDDGVIVGIGIVGQIDITNRLIVCDTMMRAGKIPLEAGSLENSVKWYRYQLSGVFVIAIEEVRPVDEKSHIQCPSKCECASYP